MRRLLALTLALSGAACGRPVVTSAAPGGPTTSDITPDDLRHRLFLIAHDSMMGRGTGSEGNWKSQEYIASEFRRFGLEPAGENGTYFQAVPFWNVGVDPATRLRADGTRLALWKDFVPTQSFAMPLTLTEAQVVYAGSLADTARLMPGDNVEGKVVIADVPPGTPFQTAALLGRRYATAALIARVQLERIAPEAISRLQGRPVPDSSRNPRALHGLQITRSAAAAMLGVSLDSAAPGMTGSQVTAFINFARTPTARPARNVVAILRGSDPALRGQYLSLTAHNDHVGFDRSPVDHDSLRAFNRVVRPMGADSPQRAATPEEWMRIRAILDSLRRVNPPRLDSIRNGADDDGSGTVSILEIAEKLAAGPRPRRSVLFVSHTGEEDGLIGSRWFTDHATVPTDSIVAEIDQDMIGRALPSDLPGGFDRPAGASTYIEVIGARRLSREFGDTLEAANSRQPTPFVFDYTYDATGHPLQYYCRADHYSYARYGIPAVAFSRGEHLDYHQITDEPQYINYPDLARVSNLVHTAALAIANMPSRPKLDAPKPPLNQPCRQ